MLYICIIWTLDVQICIILIQSHLKFLICGECAFESIKVQIKGMHQFLLNQWIWQLACGYFWIYDFYLNSRCGWIYSSRF
jgi:hypothetical protein